MGAASSQLSPPLPERLLDEKGLIKEADHNISCPVSGNSGYSWLCPFIKSNSQESVSGPTLPIQPVKGLLPGSLVVDSPPNPETPNLSSETFVSSIPKAGAHKEYWIYPSDQRWYNAAKKKEEKFQADFSITPDEKLTEDAVPAAVYIHNHLNEQAWKEILEYENFFKDSEPKLKSFRGRAKDFTPKARLFHLLGLAPLPFDRHDWIIESEGVERKYVIDYYSDLKEEQALGVPVIYMDVRPCALSPWGLINRVRIFIKTKRGEA